MQWAHAHRQEDCIEPRDLADADKPGPASVADVLECDRRRLIEEATRLAIESVEKGWGGPFGAVIDDAFQYEDFALPWSERRVLVTAGCERDVALAAFGAWMRKADRHPY